MHTERQSRFRRQCDRVFRCLVAAIAAESLDRRCIPTSYWWRYASPERSGCVFLAKGQDRLRH